MELFLKPKDPLGNIILYNPLFCYFVRFLDVDVSVLQIQTYYYKANPTTESLHRAVNHISLYFVKYSLHTKMCEILVKVLLKI
jgi:hypothetical protein